MAKKKKVNSNTHTHTHTQTHNVGQCGREAVARNSIGPNRTERT